MYAFNFPIMDAQQFEQFQQEIAAVQQKYGLQEVMIVVADDNARKWWVSYGASVDSGQRFRPFVMDIVSFLRKRPEFTMHEGVFIKK